MQRRRLAPLLLNLGLRRVGHIARPANRSRASRFGLIRRSGDHITELSRTDTQMQFDQLW